MRPFFFALVRSRSNIILALALGVVVIIAYWPGLHGGFLFDDFGNLTALGASGPIDNWPAFWRYITSGTADPSGRPLTLLSFLLDARNWPAAAYPFKRTNLILHLLNGALLALVLRRLGGLAFASNPASSRYRLNMAAVIGAGFWLLHPLWVSTTLYIVQREAMLPAAFTLLGLLMWLRGRCALRGGDLATGLIWIALGLGGCTVLGVLSKANGVLLPVLALVIEYALLRQVARRALPAASLHRVQPGVRGQYPLGEMEAEAEVVPAVEGAGRASKSIATEVDPTPERQRRVYAWAMGVFGWLPSLLVAGYLLDSAWNGFMHGVSAVRPWTMGQRLLTEPRILMQYLDLLWLPRPFTPGLFNDQIQASVSLWSPLTTLPSLLAVLGLMLAAWLLRKRWPALAVAILFYFVGQSIESSTIPLELYFEHRNYLPAMLLFWPLALWLCGVPQHGLLAARASRLKSLPHWTEVHVGATSVAIGVKAVATEAAGQAGASRVGALLPSRLQQPIARRTAWAKCMLAAVLLLGLALMTHARAQLWGDTHQQGELWAMLNPGSPRAQANAALLEMATGQPRQAIARLGTLLYTAPDEVQLAFNLIGAHCMLGVLGPSDLAQAHYAIAHTRDPGALLTHWFDGSIPLAIAGRCRGLDLDALDSLLDAGLTNQKLTDIHGRRQDLLYLKGRIALARQDPAIALRDFNAALDQDVRPGAALEQAALLGSAGYPREGLAHLEHYQIVRNRELEPGFGMPWLHALVLRRQNYWSQEIAHLRDTLRADAARRTQDVP